jgi:hypothetical protein
MDEKDLYSCHYKVFRSSVLHVCKPYTTFSFGCGVAQLVVHRLAVKQARVRFSARHPMEVILLLSEEAMRLQEDGPR